MIGIGSSDGDPQHQSLVPEARSPKRRAVPPVAHRIPVLRRSRRDLLDLPVPPRLAAGRRARSGLRQGIG